MPRSSAVVVENNFSKGLITEATAMNYPEDCVVSTDNCIYTKNGKVIRRYGIDYETGYLLNTFSTMSVMASAGTPSDYYSNIVVNEYVWTTVSNSGSISFLVQQLGDRIVFFEVTDDNNLSGNLKSFSIDLDTYLVTVPGDNFGQYTARYECSFSSGFGYLFITHPLCNPLYVSYSLTTDTITTSAITIEVRDFERLDDSLDVDERPATLTDLHKYNLYNQGWYISALDTAATLQQVVTEWDSVRTDFPSNADQWWVYKDATEEFDPAGQVNKFAIGNSPAPNGHYIYNAFLIDRDAVLGTTGLPELNSNGARPSVNAFYSGRIWYSGVDAVDFSTHIYFSRIIEGVNDFGKCYQANDPTSEDNADLLPNDGGVISIPDIDQVIRLVPVRDAILVFCTNGLWKISGPNGVFTANDYSVTKISSVSARAKNSIVIVEGAPMWWDTAGIYAIQFDPNSGLETVVNISESTVQSVVDAIPNDNLPYVKGAYNSIQKTVHWVYRQATHSTNLSLYQYDKLLVFNVVGASFSQHTFSDPSGPYVSGVIFTTNSNNDALLTVPQASIMKFITTGAIGAAGVMAYTVSQFNDSAYLDWTTYDSTGTNYSSEFISGYRIRGELLRKFQSNYITVIMEMEENSSCLMQGVWDYSDSGTYGRLTSSQQVYKHELHKSHSRTKRRVRGSGYSLQLKFYSEEGKPFTIVGWVTFDTGNNVP